MSTWIRTDYKNKQKGKRRARTHNDETDTEDRQAQQRTTKREEHEKKNTEELAEASEIHLR